MIKQKDIYTHFQALNRRLQSQVCIKIAIWFKRR